MYHYDVSDSLDSYYQEIGRAGRDGEKAEAVLLFREQDLGVRKFQNGEGKLDAQQIEHVAAVIADQDGPVKPEEIINDIAEQIELSDRKLTSVVSRLEDVGAIEILPTGELQFNQDADLGEAAQAAAEEEERRHQMKAGRLRQMREYADTCACRREHLLRYFDNCDAGVSAETGYIQIDPSVGTRLGVA